MLLLLFPLRATRCHKLWRRRRRHSERTEDWLLFYDYYFVFSRPSLESRDQSGKGSANSGVNQFSRSRPSNQKARRLPNRCNRPTDRSEESRRCWRAEVSCPLAPPLAAVFTPAAVKLNRQSRAKARAEKSIVCFSPVVVSPVAQSSRVWSGLVSICVRWPNPIDDPRRPPPIGFRATREALSAFPPPASALDSRRPRLGTQSAPHSHSHSDQHQNHNQLQHQLRQWRPTSIKRFTSSPVVLRLCFEPPVPSRPADSCVFGELQLETTLTVDPTQREAASERMGESEQKRPTKPERKRKAVKLASRPTDFT